MLQKILQARENRWNKRCDLADIYSSAVISITINIPGPHKAKEEYIKAHNMMVMDFKHVLNEAGIHISYHEIRVSDDGPEAFFVVNEDAVELKRIAVKLEENHCLGRLIDIDIMDKNRKGVSRRDIGMSGRKCIVCGQPVNICIVGRKHSLDEVLFEVNRRLKLKYERE